MVEEKQNQPKHHANKSKAPVCCAVKNHQSLAEGKTNQAGVEAGLS